MNKNHKISIILLLISATLFVGNLWLENYLVGFIAMMFAGFSLITLHPEIKKFYQNQKKFLYNLDKIEEEISIEQ